MEDDAEAARVESKLLLRLGAEPTVARDLKVARRQLQEHEWDGVVLDVRLADGSGFELLEELRATRRTPVLIQTGLVDSSLPSRAFVLDAHLVYKPCEERVLRKFVDVLRRRKDRSHARVDAMVSVFARRRHLSDAEHWLLAEAMKGKSYKEMATERGTSLNTVRSQVHRLLQKTDCRSLSQLVGLVLSEWDDDHDAARSATRQRREEPVEKN